MSTCQLCFGPYNDPAGPTGKKHCHLPHDTNCRNPAFLVRKNSNTYTASVAVRNMFAQASPNDITVSFYGCGIRANITADGVEQLAGRLLDGSQKNLITGQTTFGITPGSIPAYSAAGDTPWIVGPVSLKPLSVKGVGVVFVATLTCPTWGLSHSPGVQVTQDPCAAVWVGP
jgi:hypothetical protein